MNFIQILNKIEIYSRSLPYVKGTNLGDIYEFLNGKPNVKYSLVNIDINQATRNDNLISYSVYLYYVDRLTKDKKNWREIKTMAEQALISIVNYAAENLGDIDDGYVINYFEQQFADYCAGAWVNFNLEVPVELGHCIIEDFTREEPVPVPCHISFYSDGELYYSEDVEQGTVLGDIQPTDPTKPDYRFLGWAVNGEIVDSDFEITEDTRFDAEFEEVILTYDFYNIGYASQYAEMTDPSEILEVLNAYYDWVESVESNHKVFGRAFGIGEDVYNSIGLASNNYNGYLIFDVKADVKILLGPSNNADSKKSTDVWVDDTHTHYDNVNVIYDYDLVQDGQIPANIEEYNVINVPSGSRVEIQAAKNKQINIVGIYVQHH